MARTKTESISRFFPRLTPFPAAGKWAVTSVFPRDLKKKPLNGKDDSNSVKNQRDLLNDFYRKYQEEFESITEYVDDGHTGRTPTGSVPTTSGRCNEPQNRLC